MSNVFFNIPQQIKKLEIFFYLGLQEQLDKFIHRTNKKNQKQLII